MSFQILGYISVWEEEIGVTKELAISSTENNHMCLIWYGVKKPIKKTSIVYKFSQEK